MRQLIGTKYVHSLNAAQRTQTFLVPAKVVLADDSAQHRLLALESSLD
jgi:hypothetical protein